MAEYDKSQESQGSTKLGVGMLDVLIRNLEAAKAEFAAEADSEGGKALAGDGPVFCGLFYATPGQICPFFYYHSLTETEPIE